MKCYYYYFFSGVVQNTYTNAEKLLAAAAELAQTGECNAEDIYSVAHELESHISSFAQRYVKKECTVLPNFFILHNLTIMLIIFFQKKGLNNVEDYWS